MYARGLPPPPDRFTRQQCQTTLGMGLADDSRRRHHGSWEVSVVRDVEVIFDKGLKASSTVPGHVLDREEGSIA